MTKRSLVGPIAGAITHGGLLFVCSVLGLALEDQYAAGWKLLDYADQIPGWQLGLYPVLYSVLIFPVGYLAPLIQQPWAFAVFQWIGVPLQGALIGWFISLRLGRSPTVR